MSILVLTQTGGILKPFAIILGFIMNYIYRFLQIFGINNVALTIILFTLVINVLMIPLTVKQQKFSKMSAAMNPEIQKIQKKYQGKKDQASMEKMQEETQLVYEKYGVSPTSGCLPMFIQFPFLWAMWYVIRGIPAYVSQVKDVYTPLIEGITSTNGWQKIMESIGEAKPILMDPSKYDYSNTNILIDVLYKFQSSTWETLKEGFPALQSTIESTMAQLEKMNNFLGLNIAEAPLNLIKDGFSAGAFGIVIAALMIPILAGLTQYLSVKMVPQNNGNTDQENQVAATMKTMNITMPLLSVFMCFTMPTGLGLYWITSAVVRMVQQFFINKHLSKMPMDELIEQNMEKAAKKRENKKKVESQYVNEMAQKKGRKIEKSRSAEEEKALEAKLENARKLNENAKEGSLASKANMVKKFNESNK